MARRQMKAQDVPRIQFGLSSLLELVTACAVAAGLARLAEKPPWLPEPLGTSEKLAAAFFASICMGGLLAGRRRAARNSLHFVAASCGAIALLVLLLFAAASAWHTVGEVRAIPYWCVVLLSVIPPLLGCARWFSGSICASVLLAILTVPMWGTQIAYALRLNTLHAEVGTIAEHLESVKRDTGEYPSDLSGYEFQEPMFQPLVTYFPPDSPSEGYVISFDLFEGDTTNREYGPRYGWYYYPD